MTGSSTRTVGGCHAVSMSFRSIVKGSVAWPAWSALEEVRELAGRRAPGRGRSPAPASAPTAACATSAARRACGPRTRRPRRRPTSPTTSPIRRCGSGRGARRAESPALDGLSPTPGTAPSSTSSAAGGSTRSSPRTSTASTRRPGSDPALVVEVHGTVREVLCLDCGDRAPIAGRARSGAAGEVDPPVPALRRHPEVGHDQLRSEPRAGRPRAGRRRRPCLRPAAGGRLDPRGVPDRRRRPARRRPRGTRRDRERLAHRDGRPRRRRAHRLDQRGAPGPRRRAAARCG